MARPSKRSKLSIQDLTAEIKRRQSATGPLQRRRQALAAELAKIDGELAALGSSEPKAVTPAKRTTGRRRRAVNKVNLPEALHAAMKGKKLTIAEAAEAVAATGYKTFSRNFRGIVSMMLGKHPKLFKRVGRGQYAAR